MSCYSFTNRSFPNIALEFVSFVLLCFLLSSAFNAFAASTCHARSCPKYPSVRPSIAALASLSIKTHATRLSISDRTCCLRCLIAFVLLGVVGICDICKHGDFVIRSTAAVPVYQPKTFLGLKDTISVVSNADLIFLDV